jgi:hypothetical protein
MNFFIEFDQFFQRMTNSLKEIDEILVIDSILSKYIFKKLILFNNHKAFIAWPIL